MYKADDFWIDSKCNIWKKKHEDQATGMVFDTTLKSEQLHQNRFVTYEILSKNL